MSVKEVHLANTSDLHDGEMKEVSVGETRILLARIGGRFHAVSATCPHYGGPLAEGVLCGTRVMCPWHHAVFNVVNGDLEEPPALDALACYDVCIEGERVLVSVPETPHDRRTPAMAQHDALADPRQFVILGAGAAGYAAAQTLREEGFRGDIVMITRENRAPYDRPNLSKDYLHGHAEPEWMPLRSDEFLSEHRINLIRNREVTRVDARGKTITFDGGETMDYDALLVATGGAPVHLNIPGSELKNVCVLRSFADADSIIETATHSRRAVIVGASFIAMEAAYSLRERGLEVTVVAPSQEPFAATLGVEVGALFRRLHESHGVRFKLGSIVYHFEGSHNIEAVVLDSGERIETDMVVVGVGVRPVTHFLDGVELDQDGGVVVDSRLRVTEGIYAAGDIASFVDQRTGERVRIEHWRTALQQGRTAARNMLGRDVPFAGVPFFWTQQFNVGLLYVGRASSWDEIVFRGDVAAHDFLAFYVKDNRVLAVAGMNRDREMAAVEELMRVNHLPAPEQLKVENVNLLEMLQCPVV
ncbi:MAG TPA: FAD-dependent oxidoreductase [Pyrinomonadaceae bacterium]|jgi:NADPH-dependent 2,4-dienoyl-CoA reductase/sulfur reductase-like enzyme/nitrite reductase/ring-hydroxylating ferredoxin subunit